MSRLAGWLFFVFLLSFTWSIALSQVALLGSLILAALSIVSRKAFDEFPRGLGAILIVAGAFVLWLFVSGLANGLSPAITLTRIREEWLFLLIPLCAWVARTEALRRRALMMIAVAGGLIGLWGLWQSLHGPTFAIEGALTQTVAGAWRAAGFFHNTLTFGNLFACVGVFLLAYALYDTSTPRRLWMGIAGMIASLAAVGSYSRGSIVALAVGLALTVALNWRRSRTLATMVAAGMIIAAGAFMTDTLARFSQDDFSASSESRDPWATVSRLTIWRASVDMAVDHPLWGVGPGNFVNEYPQYVTSEIGSSSTRIFGHAHNDILNFAAVAGALGALLYVTLWGVALRALWRFRKLSHLTDNRRAIVVAAIAGSVVFFVSGLSEASFADEETRAVLMLMWGLGLGAVLSPEWRRSAKDTFHPIDER